MCRKVLAFLAYLQTLQITPRDTYIWIALRFQGTKRGSFFLFGDTKAEVMGVV